MTDGPSDVWEQIRQFINDNVPEDEFLVAELAEKIQAQAQEQIPHTLRQFEELLSQQQISQYLADHLRCRRNATQRAIRREQKVEKLEAAVAAGKWSFFGEDIAVKDHEHKRIGGLIKADTGYLTDYHRGVGQYHVLEAKFWDQIRRRFKNETQTFEQLMPEGDAVRLYKSITAPPKAA